MHRRDITIAWAFVLGLWLAMAFVLWATWDIAPSAVLERCCSQAGSSC
jgi:hypothetical protein